MATSRAYSRFARQCISISNQRLSVTCAPDRLYACKRWTAPVQLMRSLGTQSYSTEAIPAAAIEGHDKEYAPKIKSLVDEISQLTLIEVADLNELLKKTLNIADTPMMPMGTMMAQAPKEEEEEEEVKQQKTFFTVKLTGFDTTKKVALIKEIKSLVPGMNLVQAKKFVESTPQTVQGDLTKDEAEVLQKALEAAGGKVTTD